MRRSSVQISPTILLAVLVLLTVLPFVSMFSTALQPQGTVPSGLTFPRDAHWENFADAWNAAEFLKLLRSNLIIVIGVVPVSVLFATMGGYALTQMRVPGGGIALGLLIFGLTLPFEAILIPLYLQMKGLGLLNTRLAIILPLIGLYMPFSVFWMRSHFVNVPIDLREAAEIDGAGPWHTFRYIQLPLAVPAWSSLATLLFIWTTNQFLLAIVLISDPTERTLAGAFGAFQGERTTNIVLVCAVSLLIITPTTLVFLAFQRHFIKALLQGIAK